MMPMELAGLFHVESVVLARRALELCLRNGEDVIIEGTLQWDGLVREYSTARQSRLRVACRRDVVTDVEVALERAKSRSWEGRLSGGLGGRFTPSQAIRDLYDRPDGGRAAPTTPDSSSKRRVFWAWKPPCRSSRPTFHRRLTTKGSPPRYPATTLVTVG